MSAWLETLSNQDLTALAVFAIAILLAAIGLAVYSFWPKPKRRRMQQNEIRNIGRFDATRIIQRKG